MKRIAVAVTAVVVMLVAVGSALAAVNTYTATYSFHGNKGSASKPAALSFTQKITAKPVAAGGRSGLLHVIKTNIYGAKVNVAGFPTCSLSKIANAQVDTSCPKKALVATGAITASVGPKSPFTAATGQACDPELHVWNAGPGKLAFFFVDTASHQCLGGQLHTGSVGPFPATYKAAGKNLAVTIPIPNTVDYPAGMSANLTGSLQTETLNWKSQSIGSKHDIMSVGCQGGKRPFSFSFSAGLPGAAAETKTVSGTAACG